MNNDAFNRIVKKLYKLCIESQKQDVVGMFNQFKQAQWLIIDTLTKIESMKSRVNTFSNDVNQRNKLSRQIITLKDFANSIAWIMTGTSVSGLRAYYGAGSDFGYLSGKNITTALKLIRDYEKVEDAFILLTDITTAINIGDVLVLKLGKPPMAIELKEGEKNAQLLAFLKDESLFKGHLDTLTEKERKITQRHFKRLQNQHKRITDLNEYLKDGNRRYDEYFDTHVHIVEQSLTEKTYTKSIQNAYQKMDERIKTLKLRGGLTVLIAKSSYRNDDVLYLKHTVYHRSHHHCRAQCVVKNQNLSADAIEAEMKGIMSIEVSSWMQNIGRPGYIPLTTSLEGFNKELALKILTRKVTLYIHMDVGTFIEYLKKSGIQIQLRKPLGGSHVASALVVHKKKNVIMNGRARLTAAFLNHIILNLSHPLHEVEIQKVLTEKVANLTEDEIEGMMRPKSNG